MRAWSSRASMRPTAILSPAREVVAHEVLEDDAHAAAQLLEVVFAEVVAVEQDAALVRVVEPGQQLHQRRLAGAVLADQRHHLARLQGEAEMADRPALGAGIDEADILEHEAVADRMRERPRIGRRQDLRPRLEEGEQVVEIERLPRHRREAEQQAFEQGAQAQERARQERQIADRELALQRAPDDVGIGRVVADRADGGEHAAPHGALQRRAPGWPRRIRRRAACSARSGSRAGRRSSLPWRSRRWPRSGAHSRARAARACGRNRACRSAR